MTNKFFYIYEVLFILDVHRGMYPCTLYDPNILSKAWARIFPYKRNKDFKQNMIYWRIWYLNLGREFFYLKGVKISYKTWYIEELDILNLGANFIWARIIRARIIRARIIQARIIRARIIRARILSIIYFSFEKIEIEGHWPPLRPPRG